MRSLPNETALYAAAVLLLAALLAHEWLATRTRRRTRPATHPATLPRGTATRDEVEDARRRATAALAALDGRRGEAGGMSAPTSYPVPCEYNARFRDPTQRCNAPSVYRYPAMGGGWAYLCATHGAQHARWSQHVTEGAGAGLLECYPNGYDDWDPRAGDTR